AVFGLMQLVRYPRTNPPIRGDLEAPAAVKATLRRACYGCHSNETRWPWYSAIAPASWLAHYDVTEARRRLNFSEWADYAYDPGTRAHKLEEMAELISSREMPPWYYCMMHPEARLDRAQRESMLRWIARENRDRPR
ncbi:MAG TPA: heme-binding domain-containing protein, partial [Candidatus Binataceae bacterium]|nr:heme-binding domain-containing protein [Candidatus Binataceae bacterium]